jgi:hypothetical protein
MHRVDNPFDLAELMQLCESSGEGPEGYQNPFTATFNLGQLDAQPLSFHAKFSENGG